MTHTTSGPPVMKQQITCMASSYSPSIKFPFLSSHVLTILYSPLNTYKTLVAQSLVQPNCVFVARIVILKTDMNCYFFKKCDLFSLPCPWRGDFSSVTWLTKSTTPNWNCFQKIATQFLAAISIALWLTLRTFGEEPQIKLCCLKWPKVQTRIRKPLETFIKHKMMSYHGCLLVV